VLANRHDNLDVPVAHRRDDVVHRLQMAEERARGGAPRDADPGPVGALAQPRRCDPRTVVRHVPHHPPVTGGGDLQGRRARVDRDRAGWIGDEAVPVEERPDDVCFEWPAAECVVGAVQVPDGGHSGKAGRDRPGVRARLVDHQVRSGGDPCRVVDHRLRGGDEHRHGSTRARVLVLVGSRTGPHRGQIRRRPDRMAGQPARRDHGVEPGRVQHAYVVPGGAQRPAERHHREVVRRCAEGDDEDAHAGSAQHGGAGDGDERRRGQRCPE
jgi:hypothetical protein